MQQTLPNMKTTDAYLVNIEIQKIHDKSLWHRGRCTVLKHEVVGSSCYQSTHTRKKKKKKEKRIAPMPIEHLDITN